MIKIYINWGMQNLYNNIYIEEREIVDIKQLESYLREAKNDGALEVKIKYE